MDPQPRKHRSRFRVASKSTRAAYHVTEYEDGVTVVVPLFRSDPKAGPRPLPGIYPTPFDAEHACQEVIAGCRAAGQGRPAPIRGVWHTLIWGSPQGGVPS